MAQIRKNDRVKVIAGKEQGKEGRVLKIYVEKGTALVERVNFVKRHTRPGGKGSQQGGIIEKEGPLKLSKLMLVCPKCSKPSRMGRRVLDDGTRVRFCKKCGDQIDS